MIEVEAEVEFIQKTCYNLLTTWVLYLQTKNLITEKKLFLFLEEVFSMLT